MNSCTYGVVPGLRVDAVAAAADRPLWGAGGRARRLGPKEGAAAVVVAVAAAAAAVGGVRGAAERAEGLLLLLVVVGIVLESSVK